MHDIQISQSYTIDPTLEVFKGHFPGAPILPGVLILALVKATVAEQLNQSFNINGVSNQKFLQPVLPGSEVKLELKLKPLESTDSDQYNVSYKAFNAKDSSLFAKGRVILNSKSQTDELAA